VPREFIIGELEQLVLLALLRTGTGHALDIRAEMQRVAGRNTGRGALYRTLERLEEKGRVEWALESGDVPERGGHARRRYRVTDAGLASLRAARATLLDLWEGLDPERV
jgi:DNA-binding PadR family transcriptional regulator